MGRVPEGESSSRLQAEPKLGRPGGRARSWHLNTKSLADGRLREIVLLQSFGREDRNVEMCGVIPTAAIHRAAAQAFSSSSGGTEG